MAAQRGPPVASQGPAAGHELRELRRLAAAIARDVWGRGPERCEVQWAGRDLLVLAFHGGFTTAERSLAQIGETTEAQRSRENFRRAVEPHLAEVAEELTGRAVRAAIGASNVDPDLTIEVLVLSPGGSEVGSDSLSTRLVAAKRAAAAARQRARKQIEEAAALQAQAGQAGRRTQDLRRTRHGEAVESPPDDPAGAD